MGWACRWFGIFLHWGKCSKDEKIDARDRNFHEREGKYTFRGRVGKEPSVDEESKNEAEASWLKNLTAKNEREQNKHAIAVAIASAAAVDAAVAAAKAAVSVVRLTSHRRGTIFSGRHEVFAAVRIQSFFRGYLARKALRALRAVVQFQALIRGYLVRKKTAVALQSGRASLRPYSGGRSSSKVLLQPKRYLFPPHESFENDWSEIKMPFSFRQLPASFDSSSSSHERSPIILEIDSFRPNMGHSSRILHSTDEKCLSCSTTVQSSPRYLKSSGTAPPTPAKLCREEFKKLLSCPNYMASTRSFAAKARPVSSPRHRGEAAATMTMAVDEAVRSSCSQIPSQLRSEAL